MYNKIITFLLLVFSASMSFSQNCEGFHIYHCPYVDYVFQYSEQSKSGLFKRGQTSKLNIIVNAGEEYHIGVCTHRKFGAALFKIVEDNEQKTLIYDNSEDNYSQSVVFTNDVTRNLIVEVTVPLEEGKDPNEKRCVGVVVEYKKNGGDPFSTESKPESE